MQVNKTQIITFSALYMQVNKTEIITLLHYIIPQNSSYCCRVFKNHGILESANSIQRWERIYYLSRGNIGKCHGHVYDLSELSPHKNDVRFVFTSSCL